MAFMNRLVEALRRPLQVMGKDMLVTTSVGIAVAPADGDTATTVLRHAGIALARAKGDGGQRMCFFEQSMDKALQRRRMVEHELRLALGREEFEVVYQPQFDLATERQCGSEALVSEKHTVTLGELGEAKRAEFMSGACAYFALDAIEVLTALGVIDLSDVQISPLAAKERISAWVEAKATQKATGEPGTAGNPLPAETEPLWPQ